MTRRRFMQSGLAVGLGSFRTATSPVLAALSRERMDEAVEILGRATREGQVASAVLHVVQGENTFTRSFGKAADADAMFLLGSISKPISVTALMTLFDRREFKLDDGLSAGGKGCSERTFGHTESTGTIAWADPATHTTCVVLTSLPAQEVQPHPRDLAANALAASAG